MIVDFTIKNFRSFAEAQTLSLAVESSLTTHPENYTSIEDGRLAVLRSASMFGPNAAGKSNVLKAFKALQWMVNHSGSLDEGQPIPAYEPYKLSQEGLTAPVEFEIEFVVPSGGRYRYSLVFDQFRVLQEQLVAYPKRQAARIFDRTINDKWNTVKFGGYFKGGARRFPFFDNQTYLSRAGRDASAPDFVREIYRYFGAIPYIDAGLSLMRVTQFYDSPKRLSLVSNLIRYVDTGVCNITREKGESNLQIRLPDDIPPEVRDAIIADSSISYKFWLEGKDGPVEFEEDDMSDGTRRLFGIAPLILSSLKRGLPILIDEIDGHLHTNIVEFVLQLFHDSELNPNGAQLIFTSHDTNLMSPSIMRREQIVLVTKDRSGGTTLQALDSFDKTRVRADSPFEDFYRDGRLGALPRIEHAKLRKHLMDGLLDSQD